MRWLLVMACLCSSACAQPTGSGTEVGATAQRVPDIYRLVAGDEPNVPVATSEKALDLMTKYANLRDEQAFAQLVAQAQVLIVATGTKCTLSDPGFFTHEVRIDEGPHKGRYGFVPAEFVKTISAEEQRLEKERERAKRDSEEKAARALRERLAAEEKPKFRTWISADGKYKRDAKLVGYINGAVLLENRDGKRSKVDPSKLSSDDRKYISEWRSHRAKNEVDNTSDGTKPPLAVKLLGAKLIAFQTPNGTHTKAVLVDWKNIGTRPVRAVDANITLLDAGGRELEGSRKSQPIFAVSDSSPGVGPGEIYREPSDRGFILDQYTARKASSVRVQIVVAVESGAF